jgi:hypothetical protein
MSLLTPISVAKIRRLNDHERTAIIAALEDYVEKYGEKAWVQNAILKEDMVNHMFWASE